MCLLTNRQVRLPSPTKAGFCSSHPPDICESQILNTHGETSPMKAEFCATSTALGLTQLVKWDILQTFWEMKPARKACSSHPPNIHESKYFTPIEKHLRQDFSDLEFITTDILPIIRISRGCKCSNQSVSLASENRKGSSKIYTPQDFTH